MKRRELLLGLAAAAELSLLSTPAAGANVTDAWQARFMASDAPWKAGFATLPGDIPLAAAQVRGRFPDAVSGSFYRLGPAGHDLGGERNHHWFDGDGMVQRFVIEPGKVLHQGRYVATAKRAAEQRAGRRLVEGFGTVFADTAPVSSPDAMNVANINLLMAGGELLALWEGGSATRMHPQTLETLGLKTWRPDLAGVPFSAHPKTDPDGTVWNFGVSANNGLLVLYEIAPDGTLRRAEASSVADLPMVHDFAVTENHLVFLMPPLVFDRQRKAAGASFLDAHVWRPELGLRVLVVNKHDWRRRQVLTLPTGFLFHTANAWEEQTPGGTVIHVSYVQTADASSVLVDTREVMLGRLGAEARPHLVVADLHLSTGQASRVMLPVEAEFPVHDPRLTGLRSRHVFHAAQLGEGLPLWGAIARTDIETGSSQQYRFGPLVLVEEHVFVPDGDGPGWLLGTVFDSLRKQTVLNCFAADAVSDGPVAQATLAIALPLGFHGLFVAA
jgi:all-trans-8'-apo-beta-carotenal 15,15'-oxygenase